MENQIDIAAHRLALAFADDNDIPTRYKGKSDRVKRINTDTDLEKRFQDDVMQWKRLIHTMLDKLDKSLAWRLINVSPKLNTEAKSVSANKDFCDIIDYLALRRDKENGDAEEVGRLAMLSVPFQRKIEIRINPTK